MCNGDRTGTEALLDAAVDTSIRTIEALEDKAANQEAELAELRPATALALQENAVLRATADRLEREVQDHVDAIAGLTIDKTNLELNLQDMRGRADTLSQEAENLEAVLERQYQSAAELVLQRDEARAKLRALQAETDPAVDLLAFLQGLYAVTTAKEVEEAVRQDKRELAGLSEELELAHRDLEKKDRLVDQIRKAAAENRRQLEVVTADRDEKALTLERSVAAQEAEVARYEERLEAARAQWKELDHQLEQAKARATAATVEVGQLITQRVELVERAKFVARSAGLPVPTDLKAVEEFLVDLAVARNEARDALEAQVQGLAADRDRLLGVGRELAEKFPGNPPEDLEELAYLLTEVVAKEEEIVGVLNSNRELSRRRDLVMEAGRELARAHGEEPPEDLEELATLLGQLARQESSDGLPGREALLKETREQRETIHSLAHEVDKWKHRGGESLAELVEARNELRQAQAELETIARLQDIYGVQGVSLVVNAAEGERFENKELHRELLACQAESEQLATELARVRETVKDLQVRLHGAQEAHDLRVAEVEDLKVQLADQKEATEVAEHDGGLDMERAAELERQLVEQDTTLQETADNLAALRREVAEKDKVLATLQELHEVSKWTDLPAASTILHQRFGEIVLERDQLRREKDGADKALRLYRQERDELAQRLRTQAAADQAGDRQELEALRSERDRLKEDRDRLLQAERMAVQEADRLWVELSQARDQAQVDAAKFAGLETRVEAEAAQRAALKVERDHLARELAETTVAEGRASSAAQDLSSHLDAALSEMERLSQRFLESEAERFELWSERMSWSTDQTRLLGQVKDLKAELAEARSSLKTVANNATKNDEAEQRARREAEVAVHGLTRVCLEDVDIVRDGLERCNCDDCQEAIRQLTKVGYLPVYRGKPRPRDEEADDEQ